VVEMLAAGLLTLAHRSGGPLMDIIVEDTNSRNGFLAVHDKEYASAIAFVLSISPEGRQAVRDRGRASVDRFSDRDFENGWIRATEPLITSA
jgi:alpha-1,2-mannosyltransferase